MKVLAKNQGGGEMWIFAFKVQATPQISIKNTIFKGLEMQSHSRRETRITLTRGWMIFGLAILIVGGFVTSSAMTSIAGTERGIEAAAKSAETAPLLSAFLLGPIAFAIVVFAVLLALSHRAGQLTPACIVALGTLFTGFIDPLANWATFAILNPEIPHFPLHWPWFNLAPLIEPVAAFLGGYSAYYMLIGLATYWMSAKFLASRFAPEHAQTHPILAMFFAGFIISLPFNLGLQLAWMEFDVLVYTQCFGPIIQFGRHHYPILIALYDPFIYATIATLCLANENGQSIVLSALARKLPGKRRENGSSAGRQVVIAILLIWLSILTPISFFAAARLAGWADTPAYQTFPFPTAKIYDPYGDLEKAGKTGPFYK